MTERKFEAIKESAMDVESVKAQRAFWDELAPDSSDRANFMFGLFMAKKDDVAAHGFSLVLDKPHQVLLVRPQRVALGKKRPLWRSPKLESLSEWVEEYNEELASVEEDVDF